MNRQPFPNDDLELLLQDVLDGNASASSFATLVDAMRNSEELRRRACRFLGDEVLLGDEISTTRRVAKIVDVLTLRLQQISHESEATSTRSNKINHIPFLGLLNRNGLTVAAVAALIVVGLIVHNMTIMSKVSRLHSLVVQGAQQGEVEVVVGSENVDSAETRQGDGRVDGSGQSAVLGRVIGLYNAQLAEEVAEEEPTLSVGDSLVEGQRVHISSGVMEILLSTGAKLTVEGPVDFELPSISRMNLDVGKVVAAAPRTARGYTIVTPTSELVDIGTQFGVAVSESGDTELHVFDGDVVARSLLGDSVSELIHARENEALRFSSLDSAPERFTAKESSFVRRLGPEFSVDELPTIPKTDNLSLWYAADTIPGASEGDSISIWRDILVGDNRFANDARQLDPLRCPTFARDKEGRPVLRFNGWSTSLTVDPIDYKGVYTIFVACTPGPTSFAGENHGGMLFKHGESPSLELSVLADRQVRGWIWPGWGKDNVGILVSDETACDSQVSVIAYQYDSDSSQSRLWVNGMLQGEGSAPVELRQTARAYLGSHYDEGINANFFGNIYEVVVYDERLVPEAMDEMSTYFGQRYGIERPDHQ